MTTKNLKLPTRVKLAQLGVYFAPIIYNFGTIIISGIWTPKQFLKVIINPLILILLTIVTILPAITRKLLYREFRTYDQTEEIRNRINTASYLFLSINIILCIIAAIFLPIFMRFSANANSIKFSFPTFLCLSLGSLFGFGVPFFILFMEWMEEWMQWLPFKQGDKKFTLVSRYTLIAVFAGLGIILLSCHPSFWEDFKRLDSFSILVKRQLPHTAVAFFMQCINFIIITGGIASRVKKIIKFSNDMSEGNLTIDKLRVISRDEFGLLVNDLNKFLENEKVLISNIDSSVKTCDEIAAELNSNMDKTGNTVREIIVNINSVKSQMESQATGVEESTAAIEQIMGNIENLSKNIETQSLAVEQSSSAVQQMVANIKSVTQILDKNTISVNELSDASNEGQKRIQESVEMAERILAESTGLLEASNVIQNIAAQTNLLAMNAAIEAAHAGDSGRGFSVVADEIRKLSEQSNRQGKVITERLKELEVAITGISTSTKDLQSQFGIIYDLSKTVKQQEDVVMSAMAEQSAGSGQVLDAIKNITNSTDGVKRGAEEMLNGGREVVKEMNILANTTQTTSNSMHIMASGTDSILSAVKDVNESAAKNQKVVTSLGEVMNHFKL